MDRERKVVFHIFHLYQLLLPFISASNELFVPFTKLFLYHLCNFNDFHWVCKNMLLKTSIIQTMFLAILKDSFAIFYIFKKIDPGRNYCARN